MFDWYIRYNKYNTHDMIGSALVGMAPLSWVIVVPSDLTLIGLKMPRVAACIHIYIFILVQLMIHRTMCYATLPYMRMGLRYMLRYKNTYITTCGLEIGMYISDVVEWKRWQRRDMTEVVSFKQRKQHRTNAAWGKGMGAPQCCQWDMTCTRIRIHPSEDVVVQVEAHNTSWWWHNKVITMHIYRIFW